MCYIYIYIPWRGYDTDVRIAHQSDSVHYHLCGSHYKNPFNSTALQTQKAVAAYFSSNQLVPFGFAEQSITTC